MAKTRLSRQDKHKDDVASSQRQKIPRNKIKEPKKSIKKKSKETRVSKRRMKQAEPVLLNLKRKTRSSETAPAPLVIDTGGPTLFKFSQVIKRTTRKSPKQTDASKSQIEIDKSKSTKQAEKSKSPKQVDKKQTVKPKSPKQSEKTNSPKQIVKSKSPKQTEKTYSPKQIDKKQHIVKSKSPKQIVKSKSPKLKDKSKPNGINGSNNLDYGDSPQKPVQENSSQKTSSSNTVKTESKSSRQSQNQSTKNRPKRGAANYEVFVNSNKLKKLKLSAPKPREELEEEPVTVEKKPQHEEELDLEEDIQQIEEPISEKEELPISPSLTSEPINRFIDISNDEVLCLMQCKQSVALRGIYELKVVCGAGEMCGYRFLPGREYQQIYCPNLYCTLPFETCEIDNTKSARISQLQSHLINNESILKELSPDITDTTCILSLRKLTISSFACVKDITPFNRLFTGGQSSAISDSALSRISIEISSQSDSVFSTPADYKNVQNEFMTSFSDAADSPIIVLCGGKNVGKSTMSRYLVNSALNVCDTVAYLDCDVGQTEFTAPGLVSLNLITRPLLGPPFSHQLEPECCYFVGGVSPANDPSYYLKCVQRAFYKYSSLGPRVPLIVNTIGWNNGVGVCIMVEILKLIKPNRVVQLISKSIKQNYSSDLSPHYVTNAPGWMWQSSHQVKSEVSSELNYKLLLVKCVTSYGMKGAFQLKSVNLRDLAMLMHLSPVLTRGESILNLRAVKPFELRQCNDENLPMFIRGSLPVCDCYGYGLIRGINHVKKCFLIITSVPIHKLHSVNTLIQGAINVPDLLIMSEDIKKPVPYVDEQSTVRGVKPITSQRNFMRRKKYDRIS
ncbi:polynucleotide 5'-hydroxyl-kinase NOL9-like isoform X2 [Tubulanus polymorphus]|uniref:polynucleotide 5'-hydroxyl-kinase NOL9-like isoform X2 n=1 Tax=Tubulanus polymorphus TaxID=672921 RepID=UPI003DA56AB7